MARKFVIFVHADKTQLARIVHGFWYADQLRERQHPVELIFDGAGTQGLASLLTPGHKYGQLVTEAMARGILRGACPYCAGCSRSMESWPMPRSPSLMTAPSIPALAATSMRGMKS